MFNIMEKIRMFEIIIDVIAAVPGAVGIVQDALTAYRAATSPSGKITALVNGLEMLVTEMKSVIDKLV